MKIDIKEVAEVLNRHGVNSRYIDETNSIEIHEFSHGPCWITPRLEDVPSAPATTIIREAMVRDGLYMRHDIEPTYNGMRHCVGAARAITTHGSGWQDTYTEALLGCMMEAWR